jgi:O-antigen ligase
MPSRPIPFKSRPSLSFVLLFAFLAVLWVAGGASRADALGQTVVRGAAWAALVAALLFTPAPTRRDLRDLRPVVLLLAATIALVLVQLVPLPPALWQALPHRDMLLASVGASGAAQPWRPLAIVPGAAWNALSSLVVPLATLVLVHGLSAVERSRLTTLGFALVIGSALVGLIQFSGMVVSNPFVNETAGEVSGTLANRNHFALLMAIGCLLAPAWAFRDGRRAQWRALLAVGMVLLFVLAILASGSRAGMMLGVVAVVLGIVLAMQPLRRELSHAPRWMLPVLLTGSVATLGGVVLASVFSDRAVSVDRAITIEGGQDLRVRALPTVIAMTRAYFPAGSGFGGFDPMFRIHEPFDLLKLTYFNHAHNDFLEIVLDGGLAGLLLLLSAIGWWAITSIRAWRAKVTHPLLARLGSAVILLILVASAFDYPARTPIIMAIATIAALWLAWGSRTPTQSALPEPGQSV